MVTEYADRRMSPFGTSPSTGLNVGTMATRPPITADSQLGRTVIEAVSCSACQTELGLPCVDHVGAPVNAVHDASVAVYRD